MAENEKQEQAKKGAAKLQKMKTGSCFDYQAEAGWIVLSKDEKPAAEMFFVNYSVISETSAARPVTFVFNGGPGASSVYLHLGAMGPRRVELTAQGMPWAPPYKLADNEETWLEFSDLVFIDPIGTGFSRMLDGENSGESRAGDGKTDKSEGEKAAGKNASGLSDDRAEKDEYWKLNRDLESVCEFIRKYLSRYSRWESPVYLAGESYGGFRVGKLVKMLQQDYGVGLSGAVLISPALEFGLLNSSDYDVLPWIDGFPSMAGAAFTHGKARKTKPGETLAGYRSRAAEFALNELLPVLAGGELIPENRRTRIYNAAADFIGLPRETVAAANGRIGIEYFVKNLLRTDRKILGLYDASATVADPFPDREKLDSPDPTLHLLERVFAAGINSQLRAELGLDTDKDYNLLSLKVHEGWKLDTKQHALETTVGAVDDLRYGMSLNPEMRVCISHGIFDLVTPSFSTDRLAALMKLSPEQKQMLTVKHYAGGHMFYTWSESRRAFFRDMKEFYLT